MKRAVTAAIVQPPYPMPPMQSTAATAVLPQRLKRRVDHPRRQKIFYPFQQQHQRRH